MTKFYQTDRAFVARRLGAVNHLRNGAFAVYRSFTAVNFADVPSQRISTVKRTQYVHRVTDMTPGFATSSVVPVSVPGFFVEAQPPKEQIVGDWDVWGTNARLYFNREGKAKDGGNLVTASFYGTGSVTLRQTIENHSKMAGKPVTFALTGQKSTGSVRVTALLDTGVSVLESRPFYSDYFGSYYRMLMAFDVPVGATKVVVMIKLDGKLDDSAGISGAMLALGSYAGDLAYADSLSDLAVPSGTVIGWVGDACPSGYRSLGDDVYMLQTLGDPNAVRGNMYTGETGAPGTDDSMGLRGNLELGSHGHTHAGEDGKYAPTHEIQGLSFENPEPYEMRVEIDYGERIRTDYMRKSVRGMHSRRVLPDRENTGDTSVRPNNAPAAHSQAARFPEEDVEPPRVKVKLCEKI